MKTGKVAIFTQPQTPMEFREYPIPSVTPDDMLIRIRMANICGSDLHFWRGHGPKIESGIPQVPRTRDDRHYRSDGTQYHNG